jgi:hypothetical protein
MKLQKKNDLSSSLSMNNIAKEKENKIVYLLEISKRYKQC